MFFCRYATKTSFQVPLGTLSCECYDGVLGNFCAHRAKALLLQGFSEIQIVREHGTLKGTKRVQSVAQPSGATSVDQLSESAQAEVNMQLLRKLSMCVLKALVHCNNESQAQQLYHCLPLQGVLHCFIGDLLSCDLLFLVGVLTCTFFPTGRCNGSGETPCPKPNTAVLS